MYRFAVLALALALSAAPPAQAQDHGSQVAPAPALPPICLENAATGQAAEASGGHDAGPQPELMAGMDRMNADMTDGATATDIDVAFICSMIPHHQGAIDMARAELAQGDEAFPRALAEAVIAAQEKEIAEMLAWLATR